jgi:hypothetical protein
MQFRRRDYKSLPPTRKAPRPCEWGIAAQCLEIILEKLLHGHFVVLRSRKNREELLFGSESEDCPRVVGLILIIKVR